MQLQRNEIMTGLLVIGTIAVVAFLLVLLGAPGLFRPLVTYKIYFDNAAGLKQGAPVMLAGRKIGQVQKLFSPVSPQEEKEAEQAETAIHPPEANATPIPSATPGKQRFEERQPQHGAGTAEHRAAAEDERHARLSREREGRSQSA